MKEIEDLGYDIDELRKMKKNTSDFADFSFQVVKLYNHNFEKLKKLADLINCDIELIQRKAREYKNDERFNYKNANNAMQKRDLYIKNGYNSKLDKYVTELLNITDENDIIAFFNQDENKKMLKDTRSITQYLMNMYPENYRELIEHIKKNVLIYRNYLLSKKEDFRKRNDEEEAFRIFNDILNSKSLKTITDVFNQYHLGAERATRMIEYWKKNNYYERIDNQLKANNYQYYYDLYYKDTAKFLSIVDSPIKIAFQERKIDSIDCYTYFKEPLKKIFKMITRFFAFDNTIENQDSINKVRILKNLLIPNIGKVNNILRDLEYENIPLTLKSQTINTILQTDYYLPITNELLTIEDKENILAEMEINQIPITLDIFKLIINRYHNGHLELITKETINKYLDRGKKK